MLFRTLIESHTILKRLLAAELAKCDNIVIVKLNNITEPADIVNKVANITAEVYSNMCNRSVSDATIICADCAEKYMHGKRLYKKLQMQVFLCKINRKRLINKTAQFNTLRRTIEDCIICAVYWI